MSSRIHKTTGDRAFLEDYHDLMDYGRALAGDQKAVDKFRKDEKYASHEKYKDVIQ